MVSTQKGVDYVEKKLIRHESQVTLGVNLGKNKDSKTDIDDFLVCAEKLIPHANYITINLSSPNTPGLRELQNIYAIESLLLKLDILRKELKKMSIFNQVIS